MNCKNVLIIGNGSNTMLHENGHKIDTFDYVVRMGSFKIKGYEKYIGTKTDLYRLAWDRIFIQKNKKIMFGDIIFNNCDLLFIEPDCLSSYYETIPAANMFFCRKIFNKDRFMKERFYPILDTGISPQILHDFLIEWLKAKKNIKNVYYYDLKDRLNLFIQYNTNVTQTNNLFLPSGGLCTIDYIIKNMPNNNIFVTGFDNFKTNYYWRTENLFFNTHNSLQEMRTYKKWIKTGQLQEL